MRGLEHHFPVTAGDCDCGCVRHRLDSVLGGKLGESELHHSNDDISRPARNPASLLSDRPTVFRYPRNLSSTDDAIDGLRVHRIQ